MPVPGQIPLRFPEQSLDFDELAITSSNRAAIAAVRRVGHWPHHAFCLIGPAQSGLSTIARAWARECGGRYLTPATFRKLNVAETETLAGGALAIDRADMVNPAEALLTTISAVERLGGKLLLTARHAPAQWPASSPDLMSRLKAAPIAGLAAPDEALMRARRKRACARAYLNLPYALEDYLVIRLGLSFENIEEAITRLDGAAAERALSVPLVREVLGEGELGEERQDDND